MPDNPFAQLSGVLEHAYRWESAELTRVQESVVSSCFRFKSFTVHHDKCGMKVGTDAILLGAWAAATAPQKLLDIGSGTGIIALMLAQRFPNATIDAVEIDTDAAQQASNNFQNSLWADRLNITESSIQEYRPTQSYDLITCNPPYFQNSQAAKTQSRHLARHDDSLSVNELMTAAARLLNPGGNLCIILPTEQAEVARTAAAENELYETRSCLVKPTPSHPPKRHLLQFSSAGDRSTPHNEELVIELQRHQYSPEYSELAKDFLLKL